MNFFKISIMFGTLAIPSLVNSATLDLLENRDWQSTVGVAAIRLVNDNAVVQNDAGFLSAGTNVTNLTIDAAASVDHDRGTIRTRAGNINNGNTGNAIAISTGVISEAIQFSESRTIDFSYIIDGILSVRSSADIASATGALNIWDITGLDSVIKPVDQRLSESDIFSDNLFTDAIEVFSSFRGVEARGSTATGGLGFLPEIDVIDDAQGTTQSVEFTINGSIDVDADRTYLVRIAQTSEINNRGVFSGAEADFFNTGVFSFGDTGSAFYTSSTGGFLDSVGVITVADTPAPVPIPAGMPLLLGGLAAFGLIRRKRQAG